MTISIERVTSPIPELRSLIAALDAVLAAEYPPEQRHGLALDSLFDPHMRFFLARVAGQAVGCCGFAAFDGFAEIKRMFVHDLARGRGVAQSLLAHIEAEAARAGFSIVRLETGLRQVAALRLYQRAGFTECSVFGSYIGMAPQTLETSVFMEKRLQIQPQGITP